MAIFLVDIQYFPSISYTSLFTGTNEVIIEQHENFIKQTYRNRAHILTANGIDSLSVPLIGSQKKIGIKDIKIDYNQKWVNRHWRAIQSSYGKAPFFEHYRDYFKNIFDKHHNFLFDLNVEILTLCLKLLNINAKLTFTNTYHKEPEHGITDFRSMIHPKQDLPSRLQFAPEPYLQVFGNKFVQNLSIIDLLFCEGPNAMHFLNKKVVIR